jgi:hypothetical protein
MRTFQFSSGDAVVYSLVSETFDNGTTIYVVEITDFIAKNVREALNQHQSLFTKRWQTIRNGVTRANSNQFWVEILVAIIVLLTVFGSKIVTSVPETNKRPRVEQQAPSSPQKDQFNK